MASRSATSADSRHGTASLLLSRRGAAGRYAVATGDLEPRWLESEPFGTDPAAWRVGEVCPADAAIHVPVVPRLVLGIGRNYADHAAELGNERPTEPLLFLKSPGSVIGPGQPILLPADSAEVHFEGEIALVLGRRLRRVAPEAALAAVLGVTAGCDVTARDLQRADRTFTRAKSFDTFCPLGPAVQLRPRWDELAVTTRLNGEVRQHGDVRQMLWGFAELLSFASRFLTLEPGDVVLTGTPAGVGALADGDRLEVEVPGVGVLRSPVRALAP